MSSSSPVRQENSRQDCVKNIFLDFETYYDRDYNLKKLGIEEYVRDPRFEVHLLALAVDDQPVEVFLPQAIPDVLSDLGLDSPYTRVFIQNAKFDAFVITQHYGISVANPVCTCALGRWVGMSRLCGESLRAQSEFLGTGQKGHYIDDACGRHLYNFDPEELSAYSEYCRQDVELLRANVAAMRPYVCDQALDFIALTTRMYTDPVFVLDSTLLQTYADKLAEERSATLQALCERLGFNSESEVSETLRSSAKFGVLLERLGVKVPMKWSDKQGKYIPALAKTDRGLQDLLQSENPVVVALAKARIGCNSSIEASRCATYLGVASRGTTLPIPLEAYAAHTGRYASGAGSETKSDATNPQNISKRSGDTTLRQSIRAPEGHVVVACDSSQIEARVLAFVAKERWLLESFRQKQDPYCEMAAAIYGEPYETILDWTKGEAAHAEDADPELKARYKTYRNVGKTAVLQLGYYAGHDRFADYLRQQGLMLAPTADGHLEKAKRIVHVYRNKNRYIKAFWSLCDRAIHALARGASGSFGGPQNDLFLYDRRFDVAGMRVAPAVVLPDGFPLVYANLRRIVSKERGGYGWAFDVMSRGAFKQSPMHSGILCNNLTQALAFSIIRFQAQLINKRYPIRANIHDSLAIVVPEDEGEAALAFMQECMRSLPVWAKELPIDCEGEIGRDFRIV